MAKTKIEPLYMGTREACERYAIGKTTLFALFHVDGCPKIGKIGNQKRIPVKEFDAFFEKVLMDGYYKPQSFEEESSLVQELQGDAFLAYARHLMQDPAIRAGYESWCREEGQKNGCRTVC